jgi:hypothetical protein
MSYSPVCRKSGEDDISSIHRLPVEDLDRNRVGTIKPLRERFDSANSCSPVSQATSPAVTGWTSREVHDAIPCVCGLSYAWDDDSCPR